MDGGGQLTDSVVGRDRPRIAIVTQGIRYRASGFLPACDRISARAICISPKWGASPSHPNRNPRNSEEFSSARPTWHRVGGRLRVRRTDGLGAAPCLTWGGREFIALIGGVAVWPLAARAQPPKLPTIGFLSSRSPDEAKESTAAFRSGLRTKGYVD